jgi:hypothetical protein
MGMLLSPVIDPANNTGHVARVRAAKDASGGRQIDLTFLLVDDVSTIFTDTSNTNISNTVTTYTHNLSTTEADDITTNTGYRALEIRVSATETGGGAPRRALSRHGVRVRRCSNMDADTAH